MRKNVGGRDRTVRIVLGLVFVGAMMVTVAFGEGLGTATQGGVAVILLLVAGILLATAGAEKCPVNDVLGRDTSDGQAKER